MNYCGFRPYGSFLGVADYLAGQPYRHREAFQLKVAALNGGDGCKCGGSVSQRNHGSGVDVPRHRLDAGMHLHLGYGALRAYLHHSDTHVSHQRSVEPFIEPCSQVFGGKLVGRRVYGHLNTPSKTPNCERCIRLPYRSGKFYPKIALEVSVRGLL